MYKTMKYERVSKDIKDLTELEKNILTYLCEDFRESFPEKRIVITVEIKEKVNNN